MPGSATIRILLAEDHVLVREGLRRLINDEPDMRIVGEAADGAEAVRLARDIVPTIALVDISLPGWDGTTATRVLTETCPQVRVVALTRHDDPAFVTSMLEAGAAGYVLKQSPSSELVRAVRAVAAGGTYLDRALAGEGRTVPAVPAARRPQAPTEPVSEREEQILRLVATSHSNREIAAELSIDAGQVAELKAAAMRKLGLVTRLDVINYATARQWL